MFFSNLCRGASFMARPSPSNIQSMPTAFFFFRISREMFSGAANTNTHAAAPTTRDLQSFQVDVAGSITQTGAAKLLLSLTVFAGIMVFLLAYTFSFSWGPGDIVGVNVAIAAIEVLWLFYLLHKSKTDMLQTLHAVKGAKKVRPLARLEMLPVAL